MCQADILSLSTPQHGAATERVPGLQDFCFLKPPFLHLKKMGPGFRQDRLLRGASEIMIMVPLRSQGGLPKGCCLSHFVFSLKKKHHGCWAEGGVGFWEPGGGANRGVGDSSSFPCLGSAWPSPTLSPEPVSRQQDGCRDGLKGREL